MRLTLHRKPLETAPDLEEVYAAIKRLGDDKPHLRAILRALKPIADSYSVEAADLLEWAIDEGLITIS